MKSFLPVALAAASPLQAQTPQEDQQRSQRLEWWTQARFGMFIHWGIYTVPAGEWDGKPVPGLGEWIMNHARIPIPEYAKLAGQFNPVKFNADEWVAVAKNAGMKYLTITAKHHDGFAMYGSKVSRYNIVDATPFHRDPMKELAAACQRAGIKLCFYYSQTQDWHEPDAVGNTWDFPESGARDFQKYYDEKVVPQVRELLTNYGPIGLIWFDTPRNITREQSQRLADLVHELQPACLVSGRVGNGMGDYDSAGDNQISMGAARRPWETPATINDTWGFKKDDHNWKSAQVLIRQLATIASRGGNYLLNVGPTSEGVIPPESVERLAEVGRWMKANGESIYATAANPFPYDFAWGPITSKPGRLYLHVFRWPQKELVLYGLESKVQQAWLLASHTAVRFTQREDRQNGYTALTLALPEQAPDPNDSVIELDIEGTTNVDPSLEQQPDHTITLPAKLGAFHKSAGSDVRLDSRGVAERWTRAGDWMEWEFKVNHPGEFEIEVVTSQQKYGNGWDGGQRVRLQVGAQELSAVIADNGKEDNPTNPYWPYVISKLGRTRLDRPGKVAASLRPDDIPAGQKFGLTLVAVRLVPAK
ncbi:MAG TPA: alpha-L-fucosidase [Bryobacteraceae bacterium]|nr:alpha-L-fucosidase [Bryobacteraceae bacterium]